ncbi:alpha/beta fold hydrolase [Marinobacter alexandrii]|uniref:alpha/beta fold hydrolase n=1 Tax=Marinobacter alexandrii TaxID=2570351 RepID=UPI001FFF7361|nr:alpha/beta fold hydrolase [Marinobacter alexandrii]MCK2149427.1 alpha/beta fold hydrolase [Marinobacter alexandrii]
MRQQISFCTTSDGVRIAYAVAGSGPPLIRVGGWLTHVERDWGSPVWQHWLRELTHEHTLARFDIRGSGLSDHDVAEQGLEAWFRDLEAVADSLGWKRFSLIGLCQGGPIALLYAFRHPERVNKLVLYNAYTNGAFTPGASERNSEEAEALAAMIKVGWGRKTGAFRELFARRLSPGDDSKQIAWWDELQKTTASPENAVRLWRGFHQIDVRDILPHIRNPTLVAHVENDAMVPFELGRSLASQLPEARFLPLKGANHILQLEDSSWPVFVGELRRFLADGPTTLRDDAVPWIGELTSRQRVVLNLVAQGQSNAEIAHALSIAAKTVRNHVSAICGKLDIPTRAQLIVRGREQGFGEE